MQGNRAALLQQQQQQLQQQLLQLYSRQQVCSCRHDMWSINSESAAELRGQVPDCSSGSIVPIAAWMDAMLQQVAQGSPSSVRCCCRCCCQTY
jgi:hypothetical protein